MSTWQEVAEERDRLRAELDEALLELNWQKGRYAELWTRLLNERRSNFDLVLEFHEVGGERIGRLPALDDAELAELRKRLVREEVAEFIEALDERDLCGTAKEIADALYVLYGTAATFGIDIDAVFQEVHGSNMSKVVDGVERDEHGKILKGPNYRPPNVAGVLEVVQIGEAV